MFSILKNNLRKVKCKPIGKRSWSQTDHKIVNRQEFVEILGNAWSFHRLEYGQQFILFKYQITSLW